VPAAGEDCVGAGVLAVPDDPEQSLLYLKLSGEPPCGAPMPFIGDPLSAKEVDCIKEWIATQTPAAPADAGVPEVDADTPDGG
jgi:hypothetical protein